MSVKNDGDVISVEFFNYHLGHEQELKHLNLSSGTKEWVASLLVLGIPKKEVLTRVRERTTEVTRETLISYEDIRNIEEKYNVKNRRHENDATCVHSWVIEMQGKNELNPVLFYKKQGETGSGILSTPLSSTVKGSQSTEMPTIEKDEFFLILMNRGQEEMLKRFGKDIIAIDSTHGTNAYDFQLTTIMVIDDNRSGFPAAYCISSRIDQRAMVLFFNVIKEKVGEVGCNTFISDDYPAYYNAWKIVMPIPVNHLLCTWHVLHSWSKHFNVIKDEQLRQKIKTQLIMIQKETDEITFNRMVQGFERILGKFSECTKSKW